jgi:predicted nucleotidyltransferase
MREVDRGIFVTTARELTPEEVAGYRSAAQHKLKRSRKSAVMETRAWEVARRAALLLRDRFGATRVMVFGSLVHTGCFTSCSDVDIAAWGIRPEDTFRAIGMVMALDGNIEVNLVDVRTCSASLLALIDREGKDL